MSVNTIEMTSLTGSFEDLSQSQKSLGLIEDRVNVIESQFKKVQEELLFIQSKYSPVKVIKSAFFSMVRKLSPNRISESTRRKESAENFQDLKKVQVAGSFLEKAVKILKTDERTVMSESDLLKSSYSSSDDDANLRGLSPLDIQNKIGRLKNEIGDTCKKFEHLSTTIHINWIEL